MNYLLTVLTFILPFERIPTIFNTRLITVIFAFCLIALPFIFLRNREFRRLSRLDWSVIGFFAAAALSVIFALDAQRGLYYLGLLMLAVSGYFVISRIAARKEATQLAFKTLLFTAVLTAIFGIYQFVVDGMTQGDLWTGLSRYYTSEALGFPRVQSVHYEPLYFANFLLLPVFILLARLIKQDYWVDQVAFYLLLTVYLLTLSRGAFLALGIGVVVFLLSAFLTRQVTSFATKVIPIVVAATLTAVLLVFAASGKSGVSNYVQQASVVKAPIKVSVADRVAHSRQAIEIFRNNQLLGVGLGNYDRASSLPYSEQEEGRQIVNNQYLEILAETGVVGFAGWMAITVSALTILWKRVKEGSALSLVLLATLVAMSAQYFFFSSTHLTSYWFLLGLIGAREVSKLE